MHVFPRWVIRKNIIIMFTWLMTMITRWTSTFVRGDLLHWDAAAIWETEHDFGYAIITEPPSSIAIPFILRLGNHRPHSSQEWAVQILQHGLFLCITVHVHTVRWIDFAVKLFEYSIKLDGHTWLNEETMRREKFLIIILRSFCNTDLTSGLWMKILASSVLSTTVIPEVWMGCCRSSLIGLVMNMTLVSLEQTFLKPTKTVSAVRMQEFETSESSRCRIQSQ